MTGAMVPLAGTPPEKSIDKVGAYFAVIGGFVVAATGIVGFTFLLSSYDQSVPVCGGSPNISGFGQGPLSPSAMNRRRQIMLANWDVTNHPQITSYQVSALNQYAANVSRVNITIGTANVGLTGSPPPPSASSQGVPGQPIGASSAGAQNGYVGAATGKVTNWVPSAVTPMPSCGPSNGIAAMPSLGTAGMPVAQNLGAYSASMVNHASISGGLGTSAGIAALLMGGGGAPSLGMYSPTQFASQGTAGLGQGIQEFFSSGGSPAGSAAQVGAVTAPYTQSAMTAWQVGGTTIPASTPSALNTAGSTAAGQNPNSSMKIDYLATYAAPDSGNTYLSQFATSDSAVNYSAGIAQSTGGAQTSTSGTASSAGQSSNQTAPAQLSNGATDSESPSSATGSSGNGGASSAGTGSGSSLNSSPSSSTGHH